MRTGRALRAAARDRNLPACSCGHSQLDHHEYQSAWVIENGELIERRHPSYRPALFRCDHCDCEVQR